MHEDKSTETDTKVKSNNDNLEKGTLVVVMNEGEWLAHVCDNLDVEGGLKKISFMSKKQISCRSSVNPWRRRSLGLWEISESGNSRNPATKLGKM